MAIISTPGAGLVVVITALTAVTLRLYLCILSMINGRRDAVAADVTGDDRIARVAAELEIRNLIARVAHLADQGDLEEYVSLFTEDASWEYPGGPRRGRADILAGARERRRQNVTGPGSATRHIITTLAVQVEDAATATADSNWLFWRDTDSAPTLLNMGHYRDLLRREGGTWRIARREITLG
jgi:uncharacterized protein (TIGR02246 family)